MFTGHLLGAIYDFIKAHNNITDITIEDPSPEFQYPFIITLLIHARSPPSVFGQAIIDDYHIFAR